MAEHEITRIAAARPEFLGYPPESHTIMGFKWGSPSGVADLIILPKSGHLIAIVEAKRASADEGGGRNPESHAQVIGQLLKYYARARRLTVEGVERLRQCLDATGERRHSLTSRFRSPKTILRCKTEIDANDQLEAGTALRADQIGLHIIVNRPTDAMRGRLLPICEVLQRDHRLGILVWSVAEPKRALDRVWPPER